MKYFFIKNSNNNLRLRIVLVVESGNFSDGMIEKQYQPKSAMMKNLKLIATGWAVYSIIKQLGGHFLLFVTLSLRFCIERSTNTNLSHFSKNLIG